MLVIYLLVKIVKLLLIVKLILSVMIVKLILELLLVKLLLSVVVIKLLLVIISPPVALGPAAAQLQATCTAGAGPARALWARGPGPTGRGVVNFSRNNVN